MPGSIDYDVFIDDTIKEFSRLKKVYAGEEHDTNASILSMADTSHLKYLNRAAVPFLSKVIYGNAYDHMRALYRAINVINMTRSQFYEIAMDDMDKQTSLYSEKKKTFESHMEMIDNLMRPDVKDVLDQSYLTASQAKEEMELEVRRVLGLSDDIPITEKIVLSYYQLKNERA